MTSPDKPNLSQIPIPDSQDREAALDIHQSFICEAPAGSGKTELLTQRLLALLANAEKPEEVLAITFTRKAAAEMRQRVLAALSLANESKSSVEAHKQLTWKLARELRDKDGANNWQLQRSPQRLRIQTFDSFCASITRQLPLYSSFGGPLQVSDEPDEIYQIAVDEILEILEKDDPWQQPISLLLAHLDNNMPRLSQLLIDLLRKRDAWIPVVLGARFEDHHREILQTHLQHIVDDKIESIVNHIPLHLIEELLFLCRYAALNLHNAETATPLSVFLEKSPNISLPSSSATDLPYWQGIRFLLLTNQGTFRKTVDKRSGFPTDDGIDKKLCKQRKAQMLDILQASSETPGLLDALQELNTLPTISYQDQQWQILDALTHLLPRLIAQLQVSFKEKAQVDFTEISLRASQALGEENSPTDLALRLDYQIKHILVDEFQDSSLNQLHLIRQLTRGWQPGDGRTLFCVGDTMQSIYSFRGANVGLFLYSKEFGIGDIKPGLLQLQANFRSQAGIVNWVNRVFGCAFPEEDDISTAAVSFSSAEAVRDALPNAVQIHGFNENTGDEEEAKAILNIIQNTRVDKPEASVAVLIRNRSHAAHILPVIKSAGLRYRAVDLQALREKVIIQDLLSLTRALLSPADKLAWLSVLRSPWCGLSLSDLEVLILTNSENLAIAETVVQTIEHCLHNTNKDRGQKIGTTNDLFDTSESDPQNTQSIFLSPDGYSRLQRVIKIMSQYEDQRQRMPLRQWVEGCWLELGGPACLQSEEDRENAEAFFTLLEKQDHHGSVLSIEQFEKRLDKLFAQPDPKADETLQIMTIHKSKGLEFDVVIIPSLHRTKRASQAELFLWQNRLRSNGDEELVFAPITQSGNETDPTYKHLQNQNAKKEKLENCRLLYVACTRARSHLHLCATVKTDSKGEHKAPPQNSMLHYLWPSIADEIDFSLAIASEEKIISPDTAHLHRLPASWSLPSLPEINILAKFIPDYEFDNRGIDSLLIVNPLPRHTGTLVHQLLQEMATKSLKIWKSAYENNKERWQENWVARLRTLGLPRESISSALSRVTHILDLILQDAHVAWMLSEEHIERHSEFEVTLMQENGKVNNYAIDLLIRDKDGTTWIIDYKTSEPEDGQDVEAFVNAEKEKYEFIMTQYFQAAGALGYTNIKLALYFPVIQTWGYFDTYNK